MTQPVSVHNERMTDSLDWRTATGAEAFQWLKRQSEKMDNALDVATTDAEKIWALVEWTAILTAMVSELVRRVGDEGIRKAPP